MLIGYLKENSILKIKVIEKYFPRNVSTFFNFSSKLNKNILTTLDTNISGTNNHPNEKCNITSPGVNIKNFNQDSKQDLEMAISSLKTSKSSISSK